MRLSVGYQIAFEGCGRDKRSHDGGGAGEEIPVVAVSAGIGGFFTQAAADVSGEVFDRTDDEEFSAEERELELKVPSRAMAELLFHHAANAQTALVAEQIVAAKLFEIRFVGVDILVEIPDRPAPCRPAPDSEFPGEMVRRRRIGLGMIEVVSGDGTDFRGVGVANEQLGREAEKGGVEKAIVFEDDAALDMGEEPAESGRNGLDDSKIDGLGENLHGARPVDFARGIAAFGAESVIAGMVGTRSVDGDKQPGWADRAQAVDLVAQEIRPNKGDQQDRGADEVLGRLRHEERNRFGLVAEERGLDGREAEYFAEFGFVHERRLEALGCGGLILSGVFADDQQGGCF